MAKIDSLTINKNYGGNGIETADTWIFGPLPRQLSYPAVANADVASAARDLREPDHGSADGIARRIRAASRIKFGFRIISVDFVC